MEKVLIPMCLCLQFSVFALVRSNIKDSSSISVILLYSEITKLIVFGALVKEKSNITKNSSKVLLPAILFTTMNLISFWACTKIPSPVYVVISQNKIVFTMIMSYLYLNRKFSLAQVIATCFLFISSINVSLQSTDYTIDTVKLTPIILIVIECMISAFANVVMEKVFENDVQILCERNVQLAVPSICFYLILSIASHQNFEITYVGISFVCLSSLGGILVAFSILYTGAISKSIAASLAIIITSLIESILKKEGGDICLVSFYVISSVSVILYSNHPYVKTEIDIEKNQLLPKE